LLGFIYLRIIKAKIRNFNCTRWFGTYICIVKFFQTSIYNILQLAPSLKATFAVDVSFTIYEVLFIVQVAVKIPVGVEPELPGTELELGTSEELLD